MLDPLTLTVTEHEMLTSAMSFIDVEVSAFREQMINTANIYCMLSMHQAPFTVVRSLIISF